MQQSCYESAKSKRTEEIKFLIIESKFISLICYKRCHYYLFELQLFFQVDMNCLATFLIDSEDNFLIEYDLQSTFKQLSHESLEKEKFATRII